MSDPGTDADLRRQVSGLIDALEDLQRELEPGDRRRLRPPTPRELLRFTSEVGIPAAVLVLETNVRVLKLLQRTLRMAAGEDGSDRPPSQIQDRVASLSRETLDRLDTAFGEIGAAASGEPADEEVRRLLDRARDLRDEVEAELASGSPTDSDLGRPLGESSEPVDIDVERELDAIRDQVDEDGPGDDGSDDGDGSADE